MTQQESFLNSNDSHRISFLTWLPDAPQAMLVIAHGMAEHAGRYDPLARWLNDSGIAVVAIHHRGHGPHCAKQDQGHYADRNGWDCVVEDLHQVIRHARSLAPGVPLTLFGHSMGSFIAQSHAQRHGNELDKLILCATNRIHKPRLRVSLALVNGIKALRGARHASTMVDNMTFGTFNKAFKPNRTSHDWLSRDPDQVDAYLADPLCGFSCTVGLWSDFIGGMLTIDPAQWRKDLPVHLMAGSDDPVGEMGRGFAIHVTALRAAGVTVASQRLFNGARHELVNETNAGEIRAHLRSCILGRSHGKHDDACGSN